MEKKKRDFLKVLNEAEKVDEIFKDEPVPKGTSPFIQVETSFREQNSESEDYFLINQKEKVLESLLNLISQDYLSFGQLVTEILRLSMDQVPCEAGSFLEIDYVNDNLFFRAAAGRSSENLLSFTVPKGQGIVGFVCESQQAMTISKMDDNSVYLKTISDAIGFETKNLVAYPVVIKGVTFGCVELLNRLGQDEFSDNDKEVLSLICKYAAVVIENRLHIAFLSKQTKKEAA
jgi:GAF domain-containing protein